MWVRGEAPGMRPRWPPRWQIPGSMGN